ncbi:MAG TPA: F0F1 ATP synthase subunit B [Ornithinibacter sp.]|nr:F0F1 ATP synthase subunit B [Ornithinibacter sp.]
MVLASVPAAEGVGWPEALPLLPHPAEMIIGLIAFGILYWLFATKVAPKMEAMYEERAAAIEGGMQQAEEAQAEAKAALEQYNAQLAGARTEANEIRESAREQGASIVTEMRAQAQAEAARITESAKRQVDAERQQAVVQLRQEVGALSTTLAGKIVGESLEDEVRQNGIVDRFLADLEAGDVRPERVTPAGQDA